MNDLEKRIFARQPEAVTALLKRSCVGIAGAGGLGSVVAENLARAGVGSLVIADHDVVEHSNLNRQRYALAQVGTTKVQALADNIRGFNPFVSIMAHKVRITAENCGSLFRECAIIAECLDSADEKAALVSGLLKQVPQAVIVAASGIAGIGQGEAISVHRVFDRLYVIGDLESDAEAGEGLFAPRVGIAAAYQAHVIIRILAGENE